MKKLIFVLAIFIAAPAFALVVEVNDIGGGQVAIQYKQADADNLPRAFALELTIESPGQFTDISGYIQGECNTVQQGYGIFPATITFDTEHDVNNWGTPLAPDGAPGTTDQDLSDGSSHIVLEFASLYLEPNHPATSGTLCKLDYDCGVGSDLTISMTDEDTYRGGLVLEDGTPDEVNDTVQVCAIVECFPGGPSGAKYLEWASVGKPDCWCASNNPRQCRGDADGQNEGKGKLWVFTNDLNVMLYAWNKNYATLATMADYAGTYGPVKPICADSSHSYEGKGLVRVFTGDLNTLLGNWGSATTPADCATLGY